MVTKKDKPETVDRELYRHVKSGLATESASSTSTDHELRRLLENGANPNQQFSGSDRTPLHVVAGNFKHTTAVGGAGSVLLKYGADPNIKDANGETPLHRCFTGQSNTKHKQFKKFVEALLESAANPDAKRSDGRVVLHLIKQSRYLSMILGADANPDVQDKNGNTPLHTAYHGTNDTLKAKILLRNGADPTITNEKGLTPWGVLYDPKVRRSAHLQTPGQEIQTAFKESSPQFFLSDADIKYAKRLGADTEFFRSVSDFLPPTKRALYQI